MEEEEEEEEETEGMTEEEEEEEDGPGRENLSRFTPRIFSFVCISGRGVGTSNLTDERDEDKEEEEEEEEEVDNAEGSV